MILEDINNKLLEIEEKVFYGAVSKSMKDAVWDYIVFNRKNMKSNTNKTSYTDTYVLYIVREGWIPDGVAETVIDKMTEIAGMKLAGTDAEYDYITKPNTDAVVEVLAIEFVRARKK